MNRNGSVLILAILVVVGVLAAGGVLYYKNRQASNPDITGTGLGATAIAGYPPITYYPLTTKQLAEKKNLFLKRNGWNGWPEAEIILDEYGFIDQLSKPESDPTPVLQDQSSEHNFTDKEIKQWNDFVVKNADFFGIDDPKTFTFEYDSKRQRLEANQTVVGIPPFRIDNTDSDISRPIVIRKDIYMRNWNSKNPKNYTTEIFISWHFWPHLASPSTPPKISEDDIINKFVGTPYNSIAYYTYEDQTSYCPPGAPCAIPPKLAIPHTQAVKIQKENLIVTPLMDLIKNEKSGSLEMRLIYDVRLTLSPGWSKVFDAVTGQKLWDNENAMNNARGVNQD